MLVASWFVALPVPFVLMWAPSWGWVLSANALLGVSQGLTWSTTVIMKVDLAGPNKRVLAMGLNEFAGYVAVAGSAPATGFVASEYGLPPEPFYLGVGFAVVGLLLSVPRVRETKHHVSAESRLQGGLPAEGLPSPGEVFFRTTLLHRDLSSVTQAGLVNNLNDGMARGLFPLFFPAAGMDLRPIATLYPATWGLGQLETGAWSDRVGRTWLIAGRMWVQAVGIGVILLSPGFESFALGAALLGLGTAMVHPTLLAAIGDVAHPTWRASAVGVYRLWRDLGHAIGQLLAELIADAFGLHAATGEVLANRRDPGAGGGEGDLCLTDSDPPVLEAANTSIPARLRLGPGGEPSVRERSRGVAEPMLVQLGQREVQRGLTRPALGERRAKDRLGLQDPLGLHQEPSRQEVGGERGLRRGAPARRAHRELAGPGQVLSPVRQAGVAEVVARVLARLGLEIGALEPSEQGRHGDHVVLVVLEHDGELRRRLTAQIRPVQ